jgi:lysophospholipase
MPEAQDSFYLGQGWNVDFFTYQNGDRIRYATYQSANAKNEKWIILLGGRTEWIEKYNYVAEELGRDGWKILTMDHRGQGLSGGRRGHVDDYRQFALDLQNVIAKALPPRAEYAILAHSMGGLIALYAQVHGLVQAKALALSSPLFLLPNAPIPRFLAKPITKVLTRLGLGKVASGGGSFDKGPFAGNSLTSDQARYERMCLNPYPVPTPSFQWVAATFAAIADIFDPDLIKDLICPVLVLGAEEETVVDVKGLTFWEALAKDSSSASVELHMMKGARHELLSEAPAIYSKVMNAYKEFLKKYL